MHDSKHILLCLAAATLFLCGCKPKEALSVSGSAVFFDTVIQITLQGTDDEALIDGSLALCKTYENMFSVNIEGSDIYRINHAKGAPVTVSRETAGLITKSLQYSELSGGHFDITIAPLSGLWHFTDDQKGIVPDEADIREALSHVGYRNVTVDDTTVTLTDPEAQLDLGGIAKGYIADRLKDYLTKNGVAHAIINLGGNVLTIGEKTDGTPYRIGIQKPFDEQGKAIAVLDVNDGSLVSSGVYERYFRKDGILYHHILDPSTGYPYENGLLGVTILSSKSVDGDALSTTCFALGLKDGMALIESLEDGTKAVFITDDYKLHYSWKS